MSSFFKGRTLAIATMHQKELVLAPILEKSLAVRCTVPSEMDTDQFGTFSGEIPRNKSIIDTARAKCDFAFLHFGCDLVVASEGTFGPHPAAPLASSDHEFLLLKDYKHGIEITGSTLSFNTNFHQKTLSNSDELLRFAATVGFPSHGVILRAPHDRSIICKGIRDEKVLLECFTQLMQSAESVSVETDMRANYNPTRLSVIAEAANELVKNAHSLCPSCQTPGFSVQASEAGLPCRRCAEPTRSPLKNIFECRQCAFRAEKLYPNEKEFEDPMYCDLCNP